MSCIIHEPAACMRGHHNICEMCQGQLAQPHPQFVQGYPVMKIVSDGQISYHFEQITHGAASGYWALTSTKGNPYDAHSAPDWLSKERYVQTKSEPVNAELLLEAAREHVYDNPGLQLPAQVELFGRLCLVSKDRWTGRLKVEEL